MPTNEELARAQAALAATGCDVALLSSLANVTYVSGFEVPVPVGALAEFAYGSPLALCAVNAPESWLIVPDGNAAQAHEQSRLAETLAFATFDSFQPSDARESFLDSVRSGLGAAGLANKRARLGVEARAMPHAISALLTREFPQLELVEIAPALEQARSIKTEREIRLLRRAAHIGDVAHTTLAELVRQAGQNEFALWAEITARVHRAVGHVITISGELVTGPRTCVVAYPAGPRDRTTAAGDAALMDISGRVDGYWFDCTNTHIIGGSEPTAQQHRYAKASQAACEAAIDSLRPGKRASDAAAAAANAFKQHDLPVAHYAGHQIGVTVNELPRLVPYDDTPIEVGMVFSVEPGAYEGFGGTFGARSEKIALVTPSGPEILSEFAWGI